MKGRKALISVSNKAGVVIFAQELAMMGWEIVSTGGTARSLREAGVNVKDISELTGFPEILDGRLKTLHPKVHGGILGRRDLPLHGEQMKEQGIETIDLVAVNLYPFPEVIARKETTLEEAIENIDIGGPAMVRAAAKNYRDVIVVVEPSSYSMVVEELRRRGDVSPSTRFWLAVQAFSHTAYYDSIISNYLRQRLDDEKEKFFPPTITFPFAKAQQLPYGENPHQNAAFYREPLPAPSSLASGRQLQGKELSFNNIYDLHIAWELVRGFEQPAAIAVKHANPCGAGLAPTLAEACRKACHKDLEPFREGVLTFNGEVDEQTARLALKLYPDAIVAPSFSAEGLKIFAAKKDIRLLEVPLEQPHKIAPGYDFKKVSGGLLLQKDQPEVFAPEEWTCVTGRKPTEQEMRDLFFGLMIVQHAKTSAVVITKRLQALGIGAGQLSLVDAVKIALDQAGQNARGSVMASDGFLPFKNSVEIAAAEGITAIVQPGGAKGDEEVIEACEKYNIAMLFTGRQHFKH